MNLLFAHLGLKIVLTNFNVETVSVLDSFLYTKTKTLIVIFYVFYQNQKSRHFLSKLAKSDTVPKDKWQISTKLGGTLRNGRLNNYQYYRNCENGISSPLTHLQNELKTTLVFWDI